MNGEALIDIARTLVGTGKGVLAINESITTCDKRFAVVGIPQTVAARRAYRELVITTQGSGESISGMILDDETIRQGNDDGVSFLQCRAVLARLIRCSARRAMDRIGGLRGAASCSRSGIAQRTGV